MLNDPAKDSAVENLAEIPLPKDIVFRGVPLKEFGKEQLMKICSVAMELSKQEQEAHSRTLGTWELCRKHRLGIWESLLIKIQNFFRKPT